MKKACFDEISYLEPLQSLFSLNRPPEIIRRKTKLSQIPLNLNSAPKKLRNLSFKLEESVTFSFQMKLKKEKPNQASRKPTSQNLQQLSNPHSIGDHSFSATSGDPSLFWTLHRNWRVN